MCFSSSGFRHREFTDEKKAYLTMLTTGIQPVSMWVKVSSPISPDISRTTLRTCTHTHTHT